ncbi:MAG TPA: SRPBCC family protein [Kofleriaceae bacterium]|nr:SRPBCC family protein [Kofleriaceae bacterium]
MTTTTNPASETDRIEKRITLRAAPSRVWQAISSSREFGTWFEAEFREEFAPGATVHGRITHKGFEHLTMELQIERMEPERLFSFRWHPFAIEPDVDYSAESTTLVEIRLEPAQGGTELIVSESGFDRIPASRRAKAFEMNAKGWAEQLRNIERHVAGA